MSKSKNKYDYQFRTIYDWNYTHSTPQTWQGWHEAYFGRVSSVLKANREWIRLHDRGCTTPGSASQNCSLTCGNATSMFSSPESIWNCLALATVSMETAQGNKTIDPDDLRVKHEHFDLGDTETLRAFNQLNVFGKVRQCFWQSCTDSKYGKCAQGLQKFKCEPVNPDNLSLFGDVIKNQYCQDADIGIDSDIAGPGVLIAYMIQISLVLFLAILFWLTFLVWPKRRFARASKRSPRPGVNPDFELRRSEDKASGTQAKTRGDLIKVVDSALSDLQEAQTAFGLTIGVIFLVAFVQGKLGLANVASLSSYTVNRDIAYGLLIVGTISIAVIHQCLRLAGKHSIPWSLTLGLSWFLLIASHISREKGSWADPEVFVDNLKMHAKINDCGDNPGPMSFCLGPQNLGPNESFFDNTKMLIYVVHTIYAVLVLRDLIWLMSRIKWLMSRIKYVGIVEDWLDQIRRRYHILLVLPLSFNLLGIAVLIVGFCEVIKTFSKLKNLNDGQLSWAFGQFAAIAIWFPAVIKFMRLLCMWLHPPPPGRASRASR